MINPETTLAFHNACCMTRRGGGSLLVLLGASFLAFASLQNWHMALATILLFLGVLSLARPHIPLHRSVPAVWLFILIYCTFALRAIGPDSNAHLYALLLVFVRRPAEQPSLAGRALPIVTVILFSFALAPLLVPTRIPWPLADTPGTLMGHFNLMAICLCMAMMWDMQRQVVGGMTRSLQDLAGRDPLTGLMNRRRLEEVAAIVFSQHRRRNRPLVVILGDIDHFKQINDTFSHAGGDSAIRAVAEALMKHTRPEDLVARWGGEEFLLVLQETSLLEGLEAAERLRRVVEESVWTFEGHRLPIRMTFGIAECGMEDFAQAWKRADEALYRGKRAGRNRVVRA